MTGFSFPILTSIYFHRDFTDWYFIDLSEIYPQRNDIGGFWLIKLTRHYSSTETAIASLSLGNTRIQSAI